MFDVGYELGRNDLAAITPTEEIPGHSVYVSSTGLLGSWVRIPALNTALAADSGPKSATVTPPSAWTVGTDLYLLFTDDNASPGRGTSGASEVGYTIDNFAVSFPGVPPSITVAPVATTVAERQIATLSVSASGSPPLTYQWFKDGNAISTANNPTATSSTLTVTNTLPSGRANSVPSDSGMYHVVVTGSANPPVSSTPVQVTVNPDIIAPAFRYALCPTPMTVTVILSEPVLASYNGNDINDNFAWNIEKVSGPGADIGVDTITYTGGTTITLVLVAALDPATSYRAVLNNAFPDLAVTPNLLPAPSYASLYCFTNELLALNGTWRYNDTGVDLGANWFTGADATLPSTGIGVFDAVRAGCRVTTASGQTVGTCTTYSNVTTMEFRTNQYFRTSFGYSGVPANVILQLETYIDDGAVIYLNGAELTRLGISDGPVNSMTLANRTTNGEFERNQFPFTSQLVNGNNVIAAEVHQVGPGSSDITWGCRVTVLQTTLPVVSPVLTIEMIGTDVKVTWSGGGTLICSDDITLPRASWTVVGAATSPYVTPATAAKKFYEVRIP